ncbi:hypothetical protein AVEN_13683-1 [Araneus ventricosus]|uniref:HTH CENPB-type domain-containing protein n=1 Tax=Araneus ventricosus TaxID=182803 RepID=A0A4Y2UPW6_ARAVE|nr:hypothetical protein AVEN_13683-1 [Araneus ventricosus]
MIVEKAKKFGQDLGAAENECNYSDGWLRNFKFRHGIRRLDRADNPLKTLPEDEVEEWLLIDENEPVEQELTDEDIINIVVNPQPTQNLEESDSDAETEEKEKISWAAAAESLNKFISFAEASTSYSASEIIDFHIIRNKFYTKRQKSRKQKDIRDFFKSK